MPLTPQKFRKVELIHRAGLASARPAAGDVLVGTLYFSTDNGVLERSDGTVWAAYSVPPSTGVTAHHATHEPGGTDPLVGATWLAQNNIFTGDKQKIEAANPMFQLYQSANPVNTRRTRMEGFGDFYISHVNDADNAYQTRFTFKRDGNFALVGGLFEYSRTFAMGEWQDIPFNAANFVGTGGMTFTATAGAIGSNAYTIMGKTVLWNFAGGPFTLSGTPSNQLLMTLPAGLTTSRQVQSFGQINQGAWELALVTSSSNQLSVYRFNTANYTLGNVFITFQFIFPII